MMLRQETRARRCSPEQDKEEYMLFLHEIPSSARWQELKDLAKEYGTVHYRSADTIKPHHETGYIFIAGRQNAEHAFNQFCQRGWRGQSIVVTLNGPVDRAKMQSRYSDRLNIVVGPIRSPGFDARASQRQQQPDWNVLHAAAMINYMQQRTPPMTSISAASHRSPITPIPVTAPVTLAAAYRTQATYVGPTMNARHAPPLAHNPAIMQRVQVPPDGAHGSHAAVLSTPQGGPVARHNSTPAIQSTVSGTATTHEPARRSVRVQNLDPEVKKHGALKLFERFGTVEACRIQQERDSRGRVRSLTAFASYSEAVYAARALVSLNGKKVWDHKLSVTFDARADRNHEQQSAGRSGDAASSSCDTSRRRTGRHGKQDEQGHREQQQSTKGPLVVNGAPGSGRRRRDSDRRDRSRSGDDQSDDDASDEERESRRRDSSGRCSTESRMDDMTRMTRGVRV